MINEQIYQKLLERKNEKEKEIEFLELCMYYRVCPVCGNHLNYRLVQQYDANYTCAECLHSFTIAR